MDDSIGGVIGILASGKIHCNSRTLNQKKVDFGCVWSRTWLKSRAHNRTHSLVVDI